MVRVGGVFGAVRSSERPVVVPQPEQPNQAWRRQDLQRNLQESSPVSSPTARGQCFQTSKCTLPILCHIYVALLQTTIHSLTPMYIFIVCVCVFVCVCVCACRCQTHACAECEDRGQSHAVGDRWKSDKCQLCFCRANLTVECSPYCPYAVSGCPQVGKICIFFGACLRLICPCTFVQSDCLYLRLFSGSRG